MKLLISDYLDERGGVHKRLKSSQIVTSQQEVDDVTLPEPPVFAPKQGAIY